LKNSEWADLFEEYQTSGIGIKLWCENHGITINGGMGADCNESIAKTYLSCGILRYDLVKLNWKRRVSNGR
jgi:hypothetical protein